MTASNNDTSDIGAHDIDFEKSIGSDDSSVFGNAVEAIKGAAGKLADKLHPLVEQYAGLFKSG